MAAKGVLPALHYQQDGVLIRVAKHLKGDWFIVLQQQLQLKMTWNWTKTTCNWMRALGIM